MNHLQQDARFIRLVIMFTAANEKLETRTGILWTVKWARAHASEVCEDTKKALEQFWTGANGIDWKGMAHQCSITEIFGAYSAGNE